MLEIYSKYIIGYVVIGLIHFLIRYGITYRKVIKYNKTSPPWNKLKIKWSNLIFIQGLFWPVSIVLRVVEKISTIGV